MAKRSSAGRRIKFRLDDGFDLASFASAFEAAGWSARRLKGARTQGAVLDTRDRALLCAGIAVIEEASPRRRGGKAWMIPLKPAGAPARFLFNVPESSRNGARDFIVSHANVELAAPLEPAGRFERERTVLEFSSRAGVVRATAEALAVSAARGARARRPAATLWLEALKGGADTLALASGLARLEKGVGGEVSDGPREVLEMLSLRAGPKRTAAGRLSKRSAAGEAAAGILRAHFANMLACEAGARAGFDDEFVHEMRVSTRRMREALRMFAGVFAKARVRALSAEIKWLGGALGAVRDLDVYIADVPKYLALVEMEAPDYAFYVETLAAERRAARGALTRALSSQRFADLKSSMERFISKPPLKSGAAGVSSLVNARLKALSRKAARLADKAKKDEEFHAARIAFKRLRYAAEFARSLAPKQLGALARTATQYQDILGRHQDATVACERVKKAIERNRRDGVKAFLLGYLFACQRLAALTARNEFVERWKGKGARAFKASVKAAAGRL